jgi:hypothetical protein
MTRRDDTDDNTIAERLTLPQFPRSAGSTREINPVPESLRGRTPPQTSLSETLLPR